MAEARGHGEGEKISARLKELSRVATGAKPSKSVKRARKMRF